MIVRWLRWMTASSDSRVPVDLEPLRCFVDLIASRIYRCVDLRQLLTLPHPLIVIVGPSRFWLYYRDLLLCCCDLYVVVVVDCVDQPLPARWNTVVVVVTLLLYSPLLLVI